MSQKPGVVRTLTNWHAIWIQLYILGEAVWLVLYPYLNPANPHVVNGIQAVATLLIGYIAMHWFHVATTQQIIATLDTKKHPVT